MRRRLPLLIFAVALLIRLANVFDLLHNPFFLHPMIDAAEYDDWARAIRAGDVLSLSKGAFWQAPLYPYFLAAVYFLLGGSYLAARLAQSALGAVSAALVFLVGRRTVGEKAGLLAGFGAALYWPFVFFDGELLPVGLVIFFDLLTVWLLLRAGEGSGTEAERQGADAKEGRPKRQRARRGRWLAAGGALGLGILTRATSLLLVPLACLWLWFQRERLGRRGVANAAGAFLLVVGALVILAMARNMAVGGEPAVVASSGGINFYIGNNGNYDQTVAVRPGARWVRLLLLGPVGPGVTESDRSNYFLGLGLKWLGGHPLAAAKLYVKKLYLFWNAREIRRNQDVYFFRRYSHFLGPPLLSFAAVAPLGLVGMLVGLGAWRRHLLLYLFFLGHLAGVLLFFVCDRYRLPAVSYLLLFAGLAVVWLVAAAQRRRWKPLAAALALWAAALAVSLTHAYGTDRPTLARETYELGRLAEESGDFAAAAARYREAIREDANDPDFHVHLAIAEMGRGDYDAAEAALDRALALMPDCGDAYYLLGAIRQERGDYAGAEEAYRLGMKWNPMGAKAEAYSRLAAVLLAQERWADAEQAARQALARDAHHPEARLILAQLMAQAGQREAALAEVRDVLREYPQHRAAQALLRILGP